MVISVFPDVSQGFARYEQSRRARLQDQALRTQNNMMQRRQAAFRDMVAGLEGREQQIAEVMGPDYVTYAAQRDAARQQSEQAARLEFLQNEGQRFAEARLAGGDEFDENAFLRGSVLRASDSGIAVQDPELLQGRVRTWGAGYTPDADNEQSTEFERLVSTLPPEVQVEIRRNRAEYLAGMTNRPSTSNGIGFRLTFNEDGTIAGFEQGSGVTSGVYNQTPTTAGRAQTEALQGTGDIGRIRNYVGGVWSLPPAAFGPGGRALEAGVRAAEAASSFTGIVDAILGGDTAGVSQEAITRANDAFQNATGMTLQEYQALRSEGTFLVGRLLPVVTGDTRFTEMERMITETATGVRNLDDILGSQSAARGASMATYGVALQEQAIRNFRAGTPPPYAGLTELRPNASFENQTPQAQEAIGQFIDDLVAAGLSYDDAVEQSAIMAPIYADHLKRVGDYNNSVLDRMLGQISAARQNAN